MGETENNNNNNLMPLDGVHARAESFDDIDFDLESGEEIPTIDLNVEVSVEEAQENSEANENGSTSSKSSNETDNKSPNSLEAPRSSSRQSLVASAVATPVGGILASRAEVPESSRYQRAEFISAAVIKPSPDAELGISFKMFETGRGMEISAIRPAGLIAQSGAPLKVGDKVVSVNNFSCDRMDNKHAAKLLKEAEGTVKIVVQNTGGDPRIVETMIAKPAPNHPTGIGFASTTNPPQLNVSRIFAEGLFAQSLLTIGDEVLFVNKIPCRELDSAAAADIIKSAPQYVTVVAKKFEGQGVVIASNDEDGGNLYEEESRVGHYGSKKQILCFFVFLTALVILIMYLRFF